MIHLVSLAWAFVFENRLRSSLTTFATAAAVCMVVWVCSGYDSLLVTYDEYADRALGTYPLAVAPIDFDQKHSVPPELVEDLRADSAVAVVDSMTSITLPLSVTGKDAKRIESSAPTERRFAFNDRQIQMLATDAAEAPFPIQSGRWLTAADDSQGTLPQIVLQTDFANRHSLEVGDPLRVNVAATDRPEEWVELEVVGILESPGLIQTGPYGIPVLTPATGQGFIQVSTATKKLGRPIDISFLAIALDSSADITSFRFGWAPKLSQYSTPVQFQESIEIEEALDQAAAARNVKMQAYAATAMAMLVSVLVITCTLSMGVTERSRQFALLRAISMTKGQVAVVVLCESLLLGCLGLFFGLVLATLLLFVTQLCFGQLLYHGVIIGWNSLVLACTTAIGSAVLASGIPIWNATRVRPIDALALMARPETGFTFRPIRTLAAIMMVAFSPIVSVLPLPPNVLILLLSVGVALMAFGFVLLAPALVVLVQRCFTALLCWLFSLNKDLVVSQLQPHVWRTSGAAISMALGTGLFIGIQVWGYTMLQAFVPGSWAPDAMIQFSNQVSTVPISKIRQLEQIESKQFTPVVVEQPRLLKDLTDSGNAPSVTRQDNVIMVGVDPAAAFGGEEPLFRMQWLQGTPQQVTSQMGENRSCVVPEHFLLDTGLKLGDWFELVSPVDSNRVVKYQIAGSVQLDGWHWQTKMTGMRPRTHRAAALVFANYDHVAEDFSLQQPTHAWFNLRDENADIDLLQRKIRNLVGESDEMATRQASSLAAEYENSTVAATRVVHIRDIRGHIQGVARRWIWIISQVPLVTVVIASIGVLNVLLASVRSRRREYGILISIGFTQQELSRTVLLEGTMIAIVACLLSFGFGISAGWGGSELAQYNSFFGGLHPPLVVPALTLIVAATLIVSFAIGLSWWPAWLVGSAKPLQLLQPE